jgi:DNA (cytosine-5)-methyltransferase 1
VLKSTKQELEGINMDTDWHKMATTTIKVELARADIGYDELIKRLADIGVHETYTGIAAKINRGTFSFMFFMQCMKAIGVKQVKIED